MLIPFCVRDLAGIRLVKFKQVIGAIKIHGDSDLISGMYMYTVLDLGCVFQHLTFCPEQDWTKKSWLVCKYLTACFDCPTVL